jgi:hypothetical protein
MIIKLRSVVKTDNHEVSYDKSLNNDGIVQRLRMSKNATQVNLIINFWNHFVKAFED